MKISNLRLEHNVPFEYGKPQARVVCDIQAEFSNKKELWFSVDEANANYLTDDVYDAFMVAMLYPAMYYHEDIKIEGGVSKRIYHNIMSYIQSIVTDYEPRCSQISIDVKKFCNAEKSSELHVGTGFSGGVDSFSTLTENFFNCDDNDYKIDTLFFFHVGQYGNVNKKETWQRANNRFLITKNFAADAKIKWGGVQMNSNLFDFYLPHWEYDAGIFCRIASVLVFQKILRRYYISNAITYHELFTANLMNHHVDLAEMADPIFMPLLSPNGLDILCDGAQYPRTQKTFQISQNPLAWKYLNVCVNTEENFIEASNCSKCPKCRRTMMALESCGNLEKFSRVFDLKRWEKDSFFYKCQQVLRYNIDTYAKDNVDFARKSDKKLPSKITAILAIGFYMLCHIIKKAFLHPEKVVRRLSKRRSAQ